MSPTGAAGDGSGGEQAAADLMSALRGRPPQPQFPQPPPQFRQPPPQPGRTFVVRNLPPGAPPYVFTEATAPKANEAEDDEEYGEDEAYEEEYDDEEYDDEEAYDEEADELYKPWPGNADPDRTPRTAWYTPADHPSTRHWAADHPVPPRARPRGVPPRQAHRQPQRRRTGLIILPILMIIAVGAGAVKLLAHRTAVPPAAPSGQGATTPAASATATPAAGTPAAGTPATSPAGKTALTTFAAYPGLKSRDGGQLAVSSITAAGGQQLAVGSSDGYPAIWRRGAGDSWSLVRGAASGVLAGRPGIETLTAMTHGPAGWLAVGGVISGAAEHPIVIDSADGATWQAADGAPAFGASGVYAYGATAGQADYVIVGEQVTGKHVYAATWWSAGLGGWTPGGNGGLDGRRAPSAMFAVATGPDGFIAVGAHGNSPAVWTSPDGKQWTAVNVPAPAGASRAVLRQVVAHGARVVATGDAVTAKGTVPFAEASADGGASWREVTLPAPGRQAAVTALTASGTEFTAAGQSDQPGGPAAVVWTSADGANWTAARTIPGPAGGRVQELVGLTSANGTVTGVGVAATRLGERPVLYSAPVPR